MRLIIDLKLMWYTTNMKKSSSRQSRKVNNYTIQRRRISIDSRSLEKRCNAILAFITQLYNARLPEKFHFRRITDRIVESPLLFALKFMNLDIKQIYIYKI